MNNNKEFMKKLDTSVVRLLESATEEAIKLMGSDEHLSIGIMALLHRAMLVNAVAMDYTFDDFVAALVSNTLSMRHEYEELKKDSET